MASSILCARNEHKFYSRHFTIAIFFISISVLRLPVPRSRCLAVLLKRIGQTNSESESQLSASIVANTF